MSKHGGTKRGEREGRERKTGRDGIKTTPPIKGLHLTSLFVFVQSEGHRLLRARHS
jgi:hypothetical protein